MPSTYFVMIASLFPIAMNPSETLLVKLAPGVIWISVALALILSIEIVFRMDHQTGALEQLVLSTQPLPLLVVAKTLAHWLAMGVPLFILAPITAVLFHLPLESIMVLQITLLIGIPLLSLIATLGVTLTLGLHRGGLLLTILVLPLNIPVIIFATQAVNKAAVQLPFYADCFFLAAILMLALGGLPFLIAGAVKMAMD